MWCVAVPDELMRLVDALVNRTRMAGLDPLAGSEHPLSVALQTSPNDSLWLPVCADAAAGVPCNPAPVNPAIRPPSPISPPA